MKGADVIAIIILVAIIIAVFAYLLHWLYRRSTKDISFVRTGFGGEKVVMGGGAFVMMKDVSAPIVVNGRHWGGFRIGFKV